MLGLLPTSRGHCSSFTHTLLTSCTPITQGPVTAAKPATKPHHHRCKGAGPAAGPGLRTTSLWKESGVQSKDLCSPPPVPGCVVKTQSHTSEGQLCYASRFGLVLALWLKGNRTLGQIRRENQQARPWRDSNIIVIFYLFLFFGHVSRHVGS